MDTPPLPISVILLTFRSQLLDLLSICSFDQLAPANRGVHVPRAAGLPVHRVADAMPRGADVRGLVAKATLA